ncbi:hypothetical protein ACHQM5_028250 [Ranunculus cassubicifolius]
MLPLLLNLSPPIILLYIQRSKNGCNLMYRHSNGKKNQFSSPNLHHSYEGTAKELAIENQKIDNGSLLSSKSISVPEISVSTSQDLDREGTSPLVSALKALAKEDAACFHFPGHNRGRAAPSSLTRIIGKEPYIYDLPELPDLLSLKGSILDAQQEAAKLFGASETWFLVGGTTCGVQAAIMATCSPGDILIIPRNSHLSAISAMVLSGATPKYILPEYNSDWDIAGGITPSQVEGAIKELETEGRQAAAVLVTSPTYHGICSDLSKIAAVCHSHGIPLIVDEAHGAHFKFDRELPTSALEQGADLAVQSTHKVLCSLTQSSMLHMSGDIIDRDKICRCLQLLRSTSPSYLLLASLDAARAQLSENPETIFRDAMNLALETKELVKRIPGMSLLELPSFSEFTAIDPLRLTVGVWNLDLSGYEADNILYDRHGIIPELVETRSLTFAINLGTCREHVQRLIAGLEHLSTHTIKKRTKKVVTTEHFPFTDITMSLNPREAFFASKKSVSIRDSPGNVCGELICPYPPGIPVLFPGEIITEDALKYLLDVRNKGAEITGASDPSLSSIVICKV